MHLAFHNHIQNPFQMKLHIRMLHLHLVMKVLLLVEVVNFVAGFLQEDFVYHHKHCEFADNYHHLSVVPHLCWSDNLQRMHLFDNLQVNQEKFLVVPFSRF